MITISGVTFQEIAIKIKELDKEVRVLTIELQSDFDAPAILINAPHNPAIFNQPKSLASQL